ncbi:MAG: glycosyl hydrolase [Armatimonadota bacterium]|nr:glycosyl hydrolase [Armatimonadota bacterium]MCX7778471.1 glycosyl hydrolase [Armatimonadota bacterium]MDW8026050.1 glycosyl hydrolase [Armatimonadota bacterium]
MHYTLGHQIAFACQRSIALACLSMLAFLSTAMCTDELLTKFVNPPHEAKPHTWWHWMNGNITKEGITKDLTEMKRVGLGGAQVFNVGERIPEGTVQFMSEEWRELFRHAVETASKLGLEICIHNCAGWSSSGGPWIKPEHAMQRVTWSEINVQGPKRFDGQLPQPPTTAGFYRDIATLAFPTLHGEGVSIRALSPTITASTKPFDAKRIIDGRVDTVSVLPLPVAGQPQYVQFEFQKPIRVFAITLTMGAGRQSHSGEILISEDGKSFKRLRSFSIPRNQRSITLAIDAPYDHIYRIAFTRPDSQAKQIAVAEVSFELSFRIDNWQGKAAFTRMDNPAPDTRAVPEGCIIKRNSIIDLTSKLSPDGHLVWDVPEGNWTILRIGYTPTGKTNHPAPQSGLGLECDKLSREALDVHWKNAIAPLLKDVGRLAGKTFKHVLIDSYEVGSQNWTHNFRDEFRRRRGYDLLPFLPTLTGRVVDSLDISERFLWDFRKTIAELFAENYFGYFAELCHKHGLLLWVEPYGNGPFDDITCGGKADVPMCEFWVGTGVGTGKHMNAKLAASVAHTYGKKIVAAEAFTASPERAGWRNYPYVLKGLGDFMFCSGVNKFVFHRFAHQPWLDRKPGMTMGPWGFHFEWTNTWWEKAPAWITYISRCQYMLQQGVHVADVCYLVGDGSPTSISLSMPTPQGYDFDACDVEVLFKRMSVKDKRLVLPDGTSYEVLVLPNEQVMTPNVLRRVGELVKAGAWVIGPKPTRSPSLMGYPKADEEVRLLSEKIWGDCDGKTIKEHAYGAGKVIWGKSIAEVLEQKGIKPDFEFEGKIFGTALNYIHRRVGNTDIYFVANMRERFETVDCTFRVSGKLPELWHPDSGRIERAPIFSLSDGRTKVTLTLEPYGSVFVVFRQPVARPIAITRVLKDGQNALMPKPLVIGRLEIVRAIYGVLEDPKRCIDVTEHLRKLVKNNTLFVAASNEIAGDPAYGIVKKMRVDYTIDGKPHTAIVNENEIVELPPKAIGIGSMLRLRSLPQGAIELRAFEAGTYELHTTERKVLRAKFANVPKPIELIGPWEVRFTPNWGAPEKVIFEGLISWTEHSNEGIKYYSGTATYVNEFELPKELIGKDKALYLDLGDVMVIAAVTLNGRNLGILWKRPFQVEITDAVKVGKNRLEVSVTNLWVNRLIGDEQLPDDREWNPDGSLKGFPKWMLEGKPMPKTGRYTWTTWRHHTKDSPLIPSGLLGPVKILIATKRILH